jgi:multidrug efflux pump subunit AcrB
MKLKKDILSVILVTVYLIIYCALLQYESTRKYAMIMFIFSPLLVVGMVYTVLKFGKYNGPPLGDNEFGYQDKNKNEL